ncbi:MAG: hypothetical protein HUK20_09380, partial [Fibrobacter sp.]|nr:hypothetical protein [Fibrobacter sp.]
MRRSIAVLLVLFSFSFSNPREYFFIQGTPYVLRLNPDMTDSLSNGDFPERYDVLGRYIYKKYKNDLPEHTWKYTSEIALLSIKNDSLFIDSIRFSSIEAAVDLDVPLSKIFPDAKEKIFASWFSDTLRLNNDSCQKSEARNKIAPYETEYIIVFDKGRVVKKGMGTYSCIHLEWNMDSTYKELENFDSEDRNNPCR